MNKTAVKALIKSIASWLVTAVLGWSGPTGWITKKILTWALAKGYAKLEDLYVIWKVSKESKEALDKYEKVINNPEATADEINQAGDDFFNR